MTTTIDGTFSRMGDDSIEQVCEPLDNVVPQGLDAAWCPVILNPIFLRRLDNIARARVSGEAGEPGFASIIMSVIAWHIFPIVRHRASLGFRIWTRRAQISSIDLVVQFTIGRLSDKKNIGTTGGECPRAAWFRSVTVLPAPWLSVRPCATSVVSCIGLHKS